MVLLLGGVVDLGSLVLVRLLMILDLDREIEEGERKSIMLRRKMLDDRRRLGEGRCDGVGS